MLCVDERSLNLLQIMEQILFSLLEQTPVVIALGLGCYALWKKISDKEKEAVSERKAHKKEIKELNEAHALAMKELNDYIRERDAENIEVLESIKAYITKPK